jgi:hypothetical protein
MLGATIVLWGSYELVVDLSLESWSESRTIGLREDKATRLDLLMAAEQPTREPAPVTGHNPVSGVDNPEKGNYGKNGSQFPPPDQI